MRIKLFTHLLTIYYTLMAKYNITPPKEKEAAYRNLVNPKLMDELEEKIINIILVQKKYKDAFVIAVYEGKKISVKEAREIASKNK